MKTAKDPRHIERVKIMQDLFAWNFNHQADDLREGTKKVIESIKEVDQAITGAAPSWPLKKINQIDLAILRQAAYELLINPKAPPKVVVDEAVELAKEFGSESSASFVNGALGKLILDQKLDS